MGSEVFRLEAVLKLLNQNLDVVINSLTRGFSKGDILEKIRYRPPKRMVALLSWRLRHCNTNWFEQRESKARQFLSKLLPEIPCPGNKAEYNSFWVLPILVSNPEFLMAKLREDGFDSTRGNTSLICIEDSRSQEKLPIAHPLNGKRLIDHVLYLPVSESIPEQELEHLAKLVNEV